MKASLFRPRLRPFLLLSLGLLGGVRLAASDAPDLDGDGIPNLIDLDIDGDGLPNAIDPNVDGGIALTGPYAGQYIGDHLENDHPAEDDIDGDSLRDDSLGETDIDGDSNPDDDLYETDIDGDGRADDSLTELDIDGDGQNDDADSEDDIDGDGLADDEIDEEDIDGDGIPDSLDDDIDGDGRLNSDDDEDDTDGDGRRDDDPDEDDDDGDGIRDRDDDDDDNDGLKDDRDGDHHPEAGEDRVEVALTPVNAPAESRARIQVQHFGYGKIEFEIRLEGLPVESVDLVIDGAVRAQLPLSGGEAEIEFETDPNDEGDLPLDFDVLGLPIELRVGEVVYFSGDVPSPEASFGHDEDDEHHEGD